MKLSATALPRNMRRLREARALSQAALAASAGFQPAAIAHFEAGRRAPNIVNLVRLCRALRATPNDLLTETEKP